MCALQEPNGKSAKRSQKLSEIVVFGVELIFLKGHITNPIDRLNGPMTTNGLEKRLRLDGLGRGKGVIGEVIRKFKRDFWGKGGFGRLGRLAQDDG